MSDETVERTDELSTLLSKYEYEGNELQFIDIDAWATADIVRLQSLMDAELQRRGTEESRS